MRCPNIYIEEEIHRRTKLGFWHTRAIRTKGGVPHGVDIRTRRGAAASASALPSLVSHAAVRDDSESSGGGVPVDPGRELLRGVDGEGGELTNCDENVMVPDDTR